MAETGIIARVFGKRAKKAATPAEALAEAEAAIQRHAEELAAAKSELAGIAASRKALLLDDRSDQAIAELEAQRTAVELRLERLEELRAPLAAQLTVAREERRTESWRELEGKYAPEADAWLAAAREVRRAVASMNAIRGEAINAGCQAEATSFMPPAAVQLSDEAIAEFARTIRRAREIAAGKPMAPKAKPAESTKAKVKVKYTRAPLGDDAKPRPGAWVGMIGMVEPGKAAALVADGDAVFVDPPAASAPAADRAAWQAQTKLLSEREDSRQ